MGMGLMQAAQPAPYGVNRMSYISNAMQAANQNMRESQLFAMRKKEYEEERAEKAARKTAVSKLIGGPDPSTGITWETGRQGLMDGDRMSLMAQANPELFTEMMTRQAFAPPPTQTPYTLGPGQRRFGPGGEEVAAVPPRPEKPEAVSAITLEHPSQGTVTLNRRDPQLASYLQPGSGWTETARTRRGEIPASIQDDINIEMSSLNRGRQRIATMRQGIMANRGRAGIAGTVTRWGQEALGMAADLTGIGIDVPGIVGDTMQDVQGDLNRGMAEQGVADYFDPTIPQNEVFENSLAYSLARARKGKGRLNKDDVENARKDVRITGLTSVDAVLARLAAIDQEFAEAQSGLEVRLGGEKKGVPTYIIRDGKLVLE